MAKRRRGASEEDILLIVLFLFGAIAVVGAMVVSVGAGVLEVATESMVLTVDKVCVPTTDPGLFNLRIDDTTQTADAPCGGSTGPVTVSVGAHIVSETAGTGTSLANYTTVIGGACDASGNVTLTAGQNKTCTITNTLNSDPFTVTKTFSDGNLAEVTISLTCSSGIVQLPNATTTVGQSATFTVTGGDATTTCTAAESGVPAGYTTVISACLNVNLQSPGSCIITNTLNTASFNVSKDFFDGNSDLVTVALSCTSGSVTTVDPTANDGTTPDTANFTISGFTHPGTTCKATESAGLPPGYTKDESDCASVSMSPGGTAVCTITNGPDIG